jgi:hypothetical protein
VLRAVFQEIGMIPWKSPNFSQKGFLFQNEEDKIEV